jgi:2-polyprenyl-6-methoxyphenol hydroxylase-like FAD-dependent oxidoreductase
MKPIHIIGAGIAGLTLARCLKNKGIVAVVFEKNPSAAHHNYGVSLQPRAWQALLKVLQIDEGTFVKRVAVDGMINGKGFVQPDNKGRGGGNEKDRVGHLRAHRGNLESLLREDVDVKWGHALQDISTQGSEHILNLKNNEKVESAFVVDTSGVHSTIRKSLLPNSQLNVLPYVVFRGTRRLDQDTFRESYPPYFENGNVIEMKKGDILLQIWINSHQQDTGAVDISCVNSRPAQANDPLHCPGRGLGESVDIPSAFFTKVSQLSGLERPFEETFNGEAILDDRILHWLMRTVLVPLPELKRLSDKAVLLIGDSAHAMPILGGEGANVAIWDAVDLVRFITDEGAKGVVEEFYDGRFSEWEAEVRRSEERLGKMHARKRSTL